VISFMIGVSIALAVVLTVWLRAMRDTIDW
jgi:hypothetical protein